MPEIGEICKSRELGYKSRGQKYIWLACELCNKERWVRIEKGKPSSQIEKQAQQVRFLQWRIKEQERSQNLVKLDKII